MSHRVQYWAHFFIILTCDINSRITSSSMVSYADDTRLYYGISNVDDGNNMFHNAQKFQYIYFYHRMNFIFL